MKTYSYQISAPWDVVVTLECDDDNQKAAPTYQGAKVERVKQILEDAYGAFGHIFSPDATTANDLDAAVMGVFGESAERLGPIPSFDPGIPTGMLT